MHVMRIMHIMRIMRIMHANLRPVRHAIEITICCCLLAACAKRDIAVSTPILQRYSFGEIVMGSHMRIELFAPSSAEATAAARAAFDRAHALEQVLSDYRVDCEVGGLAAVAYRPTSISADLASALRVSTRISKATDGMFDATTGATSQLWRAARQSGKLPDESAIASANSRGGWKQIQLSADSSQLTFLRGDMHLDFGAIGKGITAQEALATLRALGINHAMCALSGDIACGDAPCATDGWMIDVITGLDGVAPCRLKLNNRYVSTSGDETQFLLVGGTRHSHIYDPRTGAAVVRRIVATVIADDGAVADALATALCVGGPELLMHTANLRRDLGDFEARVVEVDNSQSPAVTITSTTGWNPLASPPLNAPVSPPVPADVDQTAATAASSSSDLQAPRPK